MNTLKGIQNEVPITQEAHIKELKVLHFIEVLMLQNELVKDELEIKAVQTTIVRARPFQHTEY